MKTSFPRIQTMRIIPALLAALTLAAAGCDGGGGGKKNHAPVVDPGADQQVDTGSLASLAATVTDEDEDLLTFEWSFFSLPAGSQAVLLNPDTTTPSFVADQEGDYVLQLIVDDGTVAVAVTVSVAAIGAPPSNAVPTADAGADTTAPVNGQFASQSGFATLDGSASTDPEEDPIEFFWAVTAKPDGAAPLLNDPALAQPTLFVDKDGQYEVSLFVTDDGVYYSYPDTVIIDAAGASAVSVLSGDDQMQMVGTVLPAPLTVLVTNEFQDPIEGIAVLFDVVVGAGGDSLFSGLDHTEPDGRASDIWELGTFTGARTVAATAIRYIDNFDNLDILGVASFDAMGLSGPAIDFELTATNNFPTVDGFTEADVQGFDLYGNPAIDDDTTVVRLDLTGSALFAMDANVGTVMNGGNDSFVEIRLDSGAANIDVTDTAAEDVALYLDQVAYSLTEGPFALPAPYDFTDDTLQFFTFTGTSFPVGPGLLSLEARGDFGGGKGLWVLDNETGFLFDVFFESAPNCSPVYSLETVTLSEGDLSDLNLDGQAEFLAANAGSLFGMPDYDETACAQNDFRATLSFTSATAAAGISFLPGRVTQIVLQDPVDTVAGTAMTVDAFAADQYGNLVSDDDTTRFSLALSTTNASFATAPNSGILVAGGGDKVYLRVQNGQASIDVFDASEELVTIQLGDPIPGTVVAAGSEDGRFTGVPDEVTLESGDGQTGTVGQPVNMPLVLVVRDASGFTVPGISVSAVMTTNNGSVFVSGPTDRDGRTEGTFFLGETVGVTAGFATVGGSIDAPFSGIGGPSVPAIVMLRQPSAPGASVNNVVVRVEVQDEFGNLVPSDSTTRFSIEVDGSATWTSAVTGSAIGIGSQVVLVTVANGVAEVELTDMVDETVTITHFDSIANGYVYDAEFPPVTVTFTP